MAAVKWMKIICDCKFPSRYAEYESKENQIENIMHRKQVLMLQRTDLPWGDAACTLAFLPAHGSP
jgi:hypothetical protein